jgi:hypothetical protein
MSAALLVGACSADSGSEEVVAAPPTTPAESTTTEAPTTTTTAPEPERWFEATLQRRESARGWIYNFVVKLDEPEVTFTRSMEAPGLIDINTTVSGMMKVENPNRSNYTVPEVGPMIMTALYASEECSPDDTSVSDWKYPGMLEYAGTVNGGPVCLASTYALAVDDAESSLKGSYPSLAPGEVWEQPVRDAREPIEDVSEHSFQQYEQLLIVKPDYVAIDFYRQATPFDAEDCGYASVHILVDAEGKEVPKEQYLDLAGDCTLDYNNNDY